MTADDPRPAGEAWTDPANGWRCWLCGEGRTPPEGVSVMDDWNAHHDQAHRPAASGGATDGEREAAETCTGLTASWCPAHGDCTCLRGEEHQRLALIPLNANDCPLHAAEAAPVASQADGELRARVEAVMARCKNARARARGHRDTTAALAYDDAGEWIRRALDGEP